MNTKILPDSPSDMSSSTEQASDARGSGRSVAFGNLLVPIDFSEHSKKTIGIRDTTGRFHDRKYQDIACFSDTGISRSVLLGTLS
jgi:hypothetical protein